MAGPANAESRLHFDAEHVIPRSRFGGADYTRIAAHTKGELATGQKGLEVRYPGGNLSFWDTISQGGRVVRASYPQPDNPNATGVLTTDAVVIPDKNNGPVILAERVPGGLRKVSVGKEGKIEETTTLAPSFTVYDQTIIAVIDDAERKPPEQF